MSDVYHLLSQCQCYCDVKADTPTPGSPLYKKKHVKALKRARIVLLRPRRTPSALTSLTTTQLTKYGTWYLLSSCRKIPLFFQDHQHAKSLSDMLKIGLRLPFYYYRSIDCWWNWPRKAIWVKMFFCFLSKHQKVIGTLKMTRKAAHTENNKLLEVLKLLLSSAKYQTLHIRQVQPRKRSQLQRKWSVFVPIRGN